MNMNTTTILGSLDPDLAARLVTNRRGLFTKTALSLGALASAPLILAAASKEVFAAGLPQQIVDTLNFALTLEHIEDAFYRSALEKKFIPKEHEKTFEQIGLHEAEHVKFLTGALGAAAVKRPEADFTAGGKYADVFSNFETFLTLSQTFEDLGVAAYKGQAGNLMENDDILTAALQIHSVEARHAAQVRRIGGKKAWDGAFDEPKTKEDVLAAAKPFLKA
ncbi:ferritin-like domain-containing protein [Mesorhizobium sp. INR15]|uniref:ferritin-like domain-containing protein n=1 Tax=Mesorhizobium sp. INR15 TaxID=2654248 RepID=UPI0018967654|nr:ferritin-like domain-containing protein [Mesorhizobium sp. INR15]QPC95931.1 ferritin-like domain-containing protein [Mesorhizobium sp. INR15]